jgi:serine/threonine-protein kinase
LAPSAVLSEARAAAALSHPNICMVFAVDDSEGIPFIAMEYVRGRPLDELFEQGPLPPARAADIAGQIATGMAAAHSQQISHGDLKPANVLLTDDGVVKILDFGLARLGECSLDVDASSSRRPARPEGLKGTPAYMSPEQASGRPSARPGDVFSLGVMLYEMLTGLRAFPGPSIPEILDQVQAADPDHYAAAVPEPFATVLGRALVREPRDRTITMQEIAQALQAVAGDSPGAKKLTEHGRS